MTNPRPMSFAPLSPAAIEELADARNFIAGVATDLVGGSSLNQTERDLAILQAIVDHDAMKHANYEAWVALGIAFGDALRRIFQD
jgi:DNA-binding GntR family transcriptional regulator